MGEELPSGTVTLLFSDLEGSTRLMQSLGQRWAPVLDRSRELCRAAWAAHGGHELGTEGDSFFVAFADAEEAVVAAVEAQQALASEPWPDDAVVRARIGLHTGHPERHRDGYVGFDVHLAARVAGAAHGGQVLASSGTVERWQAPEGWRLVDLGLHGLKDMPQQVRLLQVAGPGLQQEFPRLRTRVLLGNLPPTDGDLVGRDQERAELRAALVGGTRLVTLTGPGGSGKTRLALGVADDVAHEFADGAWFVPLGAVASADEVWSSLADVLQLPSSGATSDLLQGIAPQHCLLVLDNLEQVRDADEVVRSLLEAGDRVHVLATSRRALHVRDEHEHGVPPLVLPDRDSLAAAAQAGAVQLFVQTASRVRRDFTLDETTWRDVVTICRRLDGLPLAIELVAARSKLFGPAALVARLGSTLDLASPDRSRDGRQRTIRGAIRWSFDLLAPEHQHVLTSLAVFVGGADLEAAEQVVPPEGCAGREVEDLVFDLVDHSLVGVTESANGEPRLHLLETVRAFALDELRAGGSYVEVEARHAQFFYDLAERLFARRTGPDEAAVRVEFVREQPNLAAALEGGSGGLSDARYDDTQVPPADAMALFFSLALDLSRWSEASEWADRCLTLQKPGSPEATVAALRVQAYFRDRTDSEEALRVASAAWSLLQGLPERPRPPWLDHHFLRPRVLTRVAAALQDLGRLDEARAVCDELIVLTEGRPYDERRYALQAAALQAHHEDDHERALSVLSEAAGLAELAGLVKESLVNHNNAADTEVILGRHDEALRRLTAIAPAVLDLGDPVFLAYFAETLGAAITHAHPEVAVRLYAASGAFRSDAGTSRSAAEDRDEEAHIATLRSTLGERAWDREVAAAVGRDVADVIAETLALLDADRT